MLYFDFINPYIVYFFFLGLTIFSIYAIFTKKDFIRKHKKLIYIIVTILLIWTQIARYFVVYLRGDFLLTENLPFYICRLSVVVLLYYVITKDKRVASFLFYWGATGFAGILYPNGPMSNVANLTETFYIDHYLLSITPFFLLVYEGYKPVRKDLFIITGVVFAILTIFIPINYILGSDYFYLADQSVFGLLVPNAHVMLFIIVHTFAVFCLFSIYYNIFKNMKV